MRATDVLTAGGTTVHAFYVLYAVGPGGGKPVEDQLVVPGSSCLAQPSFTSSVPYKAALEQAGEKSGAEVLLHLLQSDMAAGTGRQPCVQDRLHQPLYYDHCVSQLVL